MSGNSISHSVRTILVVDDEPALRGLVARMLRLEGHRVLEAGGGPDAIALYTKHIADIAVVVTDVVMPDMDGRVLAARLLVMPAPVQAPPLYPAATAAPTSASGLVPV